MVLFHSLQPEHVKNPDDLRLWTLQFFGRQGAPLLAAPSRAARSRASGLEAQLCAWLASLGYRVSTDCSVGGARLAWNRRSP